MSEMELDSLSAGVAEVPELPVTPVVGPGAQLAAGRQAMGWTVVQVAAQLKLAPRQIEAIEADQFSKLPGMTIAKGFVRAYAKLLKIDAAPLMVAMSSDASKSEEVILSQSLFETVPKSSRSLGGASRFSFKWIVMACGLLVLIGVLFVQWEHWRRLSDTVLHSSDVVVKAASESVPVMVPVSSLPVLPQAEKGASFTSIVPAEAVPVALPIRDNKLIFVASQDSWVTVKKNNNGTLVWSKMLKAGVTESIDLVDPVSVMIGNAAGVHVTLRGAEVDLAPATSGNVVKINLK